MDLIEMYLKSNGGYVHWSSLHQYHSEYIDFVFDAEKKVVENAEQFIKGLNAELELKIANDQKLQKKPANDEEENNQNQYYEYHYLRTKYALEQVLQSQRKASILSLYSLIEGYFKSLCDLIQDEFKFKIKVDDLHGSDDIQKCWLYLQKVCEIDITSLERYYTPIKTEKYFRNKIAHNNSLIDPGKLPLVKQIKGLRVSSYNDKHHLIIENAEYNLNLLCKAEKFFDELVDLMEKRYKVLKI